MPPAKKKDDSLQADNQVVSSKTISNGGGDDDKHKTDSPRKKLTARKSTLRGAKFEAQRLLETLKADELKAFFNTESNAVRQTRRSSTPTLSRSSSDPIPKSSASKSDSVDGEKSNSNSVTSFRNRSDLRSSASKPDSVDGEKRNSDCGTLGTSGSNSLNSPSRKQTGLERVRSEKSIFEKISSSIGATGEDSFGDLYDYKDNSGSRLSLRVSLEKLPSSVSKVATSTLSNNCAENTSVDCDTTESSETATIREAFKRLCQEANFIRLRQNFWSKKGSNKSDSEETKKASFLDESPVTRLRKFNFSPKTRGFYKAIAQNLKTKSSAASSTIGSTKMSDNAESEVSDQSKSLGQSPKRGSAQRMKDGESSATASPIPKKISEDSRDGCASPSSVCSDSSVKVHPNVKSLLKHLDDSPKSPKTKVPVICLENIEPSPGAEGQGSKLVNPDLEKEFAALVPTEAKRKLNFSPFVDLELEGTSSESAAPVPSVNPTPATDERDAAKRKLMFSSEDGGSDNPGGSDSQSISASKDEESVIKKTPEESTSTRESTEDRKPMQDKNAGNSHNSGANNETSNDSSQVLQDTDAEKHSLLTSLIEKMQTRVQPGDEAPSEISEPTVEEEESSTSPVSPSSSSVSADDSETSEESDTGTGDEDTSDESDDSESDDTDSDDESADEEQDKKGFKKPEPVASTSSATDVVANTLELGTEKAAELEAATSTTTDVRNNSVETEVTNDKADETSRLVQQRTDPEGKPSEVGPPELQRSTEEKQSSAIVQCEKEEEDLSPFRTEESDRHPSSAVEEPTAGNVGDDNCEETNSSKPVGKLPISVEDHLHQTVLDTCRVKDDQGDEVLVKTDGEISNDTKSAEGPIKREQSELESYLTDPSKLNQSLLKLLPQAVSPGVVSRSAPSLDEKHTITSAESMTNAEGDVKLEKGDTKPSSNSPEDASLPFKLFEKSDGANKSSAFVSSELDYYLDAKSLLQSDIAQCDKKLTNSEKPMQFTSDGDIHIDENAVSPDMDMVDGILFMSFDSEHSLEAHTVVETNKKICSWHHTFYHRMKFVLGEQAKREQRRRDNMVRKYTSEKRVKSLTERMAKYRKMLAREAMKIRKKHLFMLRKHEAQKAKLLAKKAEDLALLRGVVTGDLDEVQPDANLGAAYLHRTGKLHWRTQERLLRNLTPEEAKELQTELGLAMKKKRRKLVPFTHKKTKVDKSSNGSDHSMSPDQSSRPGSAEPTHESLSADETELPANDKEEPLADDNQTDQANENEENQPRFRHPLMRSKSIFETFDIERPKFPSPIKSKQTTAEKPSTSMFKFDLQSLMRRSLGLPQMKKPATAPEQKKEVVRRIKISEKNFEQVKKSRENDGSQLVVEPQIVNLRMARHAVSAVRIVKEVQRRGKTVYELEEPPEKRFKTFAQVKMLQTNHPRLMDSDRERKTEPCEEPGCRYGCICHLCELQPKDWPVGQPTPGRPRGDQRCTKEYCRLGCICDSLGGSSSHGRTKCNKPQCRFECRCENKASGAAESIHLWKSDQPCMKEYCQLGCVCNSVNNSSASWTKCMKPECRFVCKCSRDDATGGDLDNLPRMRERRARKESSWLKDMVSWDALPKHLGSTGKGLNISIDSPPQHLSRKRGAKDPAFKMKLQGPVPPRPHLLPVPGDSKDVQPPVIQHEGMTGMDDDSNPQSQVDKSRPSQSVPQPGSVPKPKKKKKKSATPIKPGQQGPGSLQKSCARSRIYYPKDREARCSCCSMSGGMDECQKLKASLIVQQALLKATAIHKKDDKKPLKDTQNWKEGDLSKIPEILARKRPSTDMRSGAISPGAASLSSVSSQESLYSDQPGKGDHVADLFRPEGFTTQMMLLQPKKKDKGQSSTCHPQLLEISSNCCWDTIRSQLLGYVAQQVKGQPYPPTNKIVIGDFLVKVLPRASRPTKIPPHLQSSLPSQMFSIRILIRPYTKKKVEEEIVEDETTCVCARVSVWTRDMKEQNKDGKPNTSVPGDENTSSTSQTGSRAQTPSPPLPKSGRAETPVFNKSDSRIVDLTGDQDEPENSESATKVAPTDSTRVPKGNVPMKGNVPVKGPTRIVDLTQDEDVVEKPVSRKTVKPAIRKSVETRIVDLTEEDDGADDTRKEASGAKTMPMVDLTNDDSFVEEERPEVEEMVSGARQVASGEKEEVRKDGQTVSRVSEPTEAAELVGTLDSDGKKDVEKGGSVEDETAETLGGAALSTEEKESEKADAMETEESQDKDESFKEETDRAAILDSLNRLRELSETIEHPEQDMSFDTSSGKEKDFASPVLNRPEKSSQEPSSKPIGDVDAEKVQKKHVAEGKGLQEYLLAEEVGETPESDDVTIITPAQKDDSEQLPPSKESSGKPVFRSGVKSAPYHDIAQIFQTALGKTPDKTKETPCQVSASSVLRAVSPSGDIKTISFNSLPESVKAPLAKQVHSLMLKTPGSNDILALVKIQPLALQARSNPSLPGQEVTVRVVCPRSLILSWNLGKQQPTPSGADAAAREGASDEVLIEDSAMFSKGVKSTNLDDDSKKAEAVISPCPRPEATVRSNDVQEAEASSTVDDDVSSSDFVKRHEKVRRAAEPILEKAVTMAKEIWAKIRGNDDSRVQTDNSEGQKTDVEIGAGDAGLVRKDAQGAGDGDQGTAESLPMDEETNSEIEKAKKRNLFEAFGGSEEQDDEKERNIEETAQEPPMEVSSPVIPASNEEGEKPVESPNTGLVIAEPDSTVGSRPQSPLMDSVEADASDIQPIPGADQESEVLGTEDGISKPEVEDTVSKAAAAMADIASSVAEELHVETTKISELDLGAQSEDVPTDILAAAAMVAELNRDAGDSSLGVDEGKDLKENTPGCSVDENGNASKKPDNIFELALAENAKMEAELASTPAKIETSSVPLQEPTADKQEAPSKPVTSEDPNVNAKEPVTPVKAKPDDLMDVDVEPSMPEDEMPGSSLLEDHMCYTKSPKADRFPMDLSKIDIAKMAKTEDVTSASRSQGEVETQKKVATPGTILRKEGPENFPSGLKSPFSFPSGQESQQSDKNPPQSASQRLASQSPLRPAPQTASQLLTGKPSPMKVPPPVPCGERKGRRKEKHSIRSLMEDELDEKPVQITSASLTPAKKKPDEEKKEPKPKKKKKVEEMSVSVIESTESDEIINVDSDDEPIRCYRRSRPYYIDDSSDVDIENFDDDEQPQVIRLLQAAGKNLLEFFINPDCALHCAAVTKSKAQLLASASRQEGCPQPKDVPKPQPKPKPKPKPKSKAKPKAAPPPSQPNPPEIQMLHVPLPPPSEQKELKLNPLLGQILVKEQPRQMTPQQAPVSIPKDVNLPVIQASAVIPGHISPRPGMIQISLNQGQVIFKSDPNAKNPAEFARVKNTASPALSNEYSDSGTDSSTFRRGDQRGDHNSKERMRRMMMASDFDCLRSELDEDHRTPKVTLLAKAYSLIRTLRDSERALLTAKHAHQQKFVATVTKYGLLKDGVIPNDNRKREIIKQYIRRKMSPASSVLEFRIKYCSKNEETPGQVWRQANENNTVQVHNNTVQAHNNTVQAHNNTVQVHNNAVQVLNNTVQVHNNALQAHSIPQRGRPRLPVQPQGTVQPTGGLATSNPVPAQTAATQPSAIPQATRKSAKPSLKPASGKTQKKPSSKPRKKPGPKPKSKPAPPPPPETDPKRAQERLPYIGCQGTLQRALQRQRAHPASANQSSRDVVLDREASEALSEHDQNSTMSVQNENEEPHLSQDSLTSQGTFAQSTYAVTESVATVSAPSAPTNAIHPPGSTLQVQNNFGSVNPNSMQNVSVSSEVSGADGGENQSERKSLKRKAGFEPLDPNTTKRISFNIRQIDGSTVLEEYNESKQGTGFRYKCANQSESRPADNDDQPGETDLKICLSDTDEKNLGADGSKTSASEATPAGTIEMTNISAETEASMPDSRASSAVNEKRQITSLIHDSGPDPGFLASFKPLSQPGISTLSTGNYTMVVKKAGGDLPTSLADMTPKSSEAGKSEPSRSNVSTVGDTSVGMLGDVKTQSSVPVTTTTVAFVIPRTGTSMSKGNHVAMPVSGLPQTTITGVRSTAPTIIRAPTPRPMAHGSGSTILGPRSFLPTPNVPTVARGFFIPKGSNMAMPGVLVPSGNTAQNQSGAKVMIQANTPTGTVPQRFTWQPLHHGAKVTTVYPSGMTVANPRVSTPSVRPMTSPSVPQTIMIDAKTGKFMKMPQIVPRMTSSPQVPEQQIVTKVSTSGGVGQHWAVNEEVSHITGKPGAVTLQRRLSSPMEGQEKYAVISGDPRPSDGRASPALVLQSLGSSSTTGSDAKPVILVPCSGISCTQSCSVRALALQSSSASNTRFSNPPATTLLTSSTPRFAPGMGTTRMPPVRTVRAYLNQASKVLQQSAPATSYTVSYTESSVSSGNPVIMPKTQVHYTCSPVTVAPTLTTTTTDTTANFSTPKITDQSQVAATSVDAASKAEADDLKSQPGVQSVFNVARPEKNVDIETPVASETGESKIPEASPESQPQENVENQTDFQESGSVADVITEARPEGQPQENVENRIDFQESSSVAEVIAEASPESQPQENVENRIDFQESGSVADIITEASPESRPQENVENQIDFQETSSIADVITEARPEGQPQENVENQIDFQESGSVADIITEARPESQPQENVENQIGCRESGSVADVVSGVENVEPEISSPLEQKEIPVAQGEEESSLVIDLEVKTDTETPGSPKININAEIAASIAAGMEDKELTCPALVDSKTDFPLSALGMDFGPDSPVIPNMDMKMADSPVVPILDSNLDDSTICLEPAMFSKEGENNEKGILDSNIDDSTTCLEPTMFSKEGENNKKSGCETSKDVVMADLTPSEQEPQKPEDSATGDAAQVSNVNNAENTADFGPVSTPLVIDCENPEETEMSANSNKTVKTGKVWTPAAAQSKILKPKVVTAPKEQEPKKKKRKLKPKSTEAGETPDATNPDSVEAKPKRKRNRKKKESNETGDDSKSSVICQADKSEWKSVVNTQVASTFRTILPATGNQKSGSHARVLSSGQDGQTVSIETADGPVQFKIPNNAVMIPLNDALNLNDGAASKFSLPTAGTGVGQRFSVPTSRGKTMILVSPPTPCTGSSPQTIHNLAGPRMRGPNVTVSGPGVPAQVQTGGSPVFSATVPSGPRMRGPAVTLSHVPSAKTDQGRNDAKIEGQTAESSVEMKELPVSSAAASTDGHAPETSSSDKTDNQNEAKSEDQSLEPATACENSGVSSKTALPETSSLGDVQGPSETESRSQELDSTTEGGGVEPNIPICPSSTVESAPDAGSGVASQDHNVAESEALATEYDGDLTAEYGSELTAEFGSELAAEFGGELPTEYGSELATEYGSEIPTEYGSELSQGLPEFAGSSVILFPEEDTSSFYSEIQDESPSQKKSRVPRRKSGLPDPVIDEIMKPLHAKRERKPTKRFLEADSDSEMGEKSESSPEKRKKKMKKSQDDSSDFVLEPSVESEVKKPKARKKLQVDSETAAVGFAEVENESREGEAAIENQPETGEGEVKKRKRRKKRKVDSETAEATSAEKEGQSQEGEVKLEGIPGSTPEGLVKKVKIRRKRKVTENPETAPVEKEGQSQEGEVKLGVPEGIPGSTSEGLVKKVKIRRKRKVTENPETAPVEKEGQSQEGEVKLGVPEGIPGSTSEGLVKKVKIRRKRKVTENPETAPVEKGSQSQEGEAKLGVSEGIPENTPEKIVKKIRKKRKVADAPDVLSVGNESQHQEGDAGVPETVTESKVKKSKGRKKANDVSETPSTTSVGKPSAVRELGVKVGEVASVPGTDPEVPVKKKRGRKPKALSGAPVAATESKDVPNVAVCDTSAVTPAKQGNVSQEDGAKLEAAFTGTEPEGGVPGGSGEMSNKRVRKPKTFTDYETVMSELDFDMRSKKQKKKEALQAEEKSSEDSAFVESQDQMDITPSETTVPETEEMSAEMTTSPTKIVIKRAPGKKPKDGSQTPRLRKKAGGPDTKKLQETVKETNLRDDESEKADVEKCSASIHESDIPETKSETKTESLVSKAETVTLETEKFIVKRKRSSKNACASKSSVKSNNSSPARRSDSVSPARKSDSVSEQTDRVAPRTPKGTDSCDGPGSPTSAGRKNTLSRNSTPRSSKFPSDSGGVSALFKELEFSPLHGEAEAEKSLVPKDHEDGEDGSSASKDISQAGVDVPVSQEES